MKTLHATAGFIYIVPVTTSSTSLVLPEEKTVLRTGVVKSVGGTIYHTSGEELESPVRVGDIAVFQYYEDEDLKFGGKDGYLVSFNRIVGVIHD